MISVCGGGGGDSMIIRSNGIETVCQQNNPSNGAKHITRMQNVLAKNGNVQKRRHIKNNVAHVR